MHFFLVSLTIANKRKANLYREGSLKKTSKSGRWLNAVRHCTFGHIVLVPRPLVLRGHTQPTFRSMHARQKLYTLVKNERSGRSVSLISGSHRVYANCHFDGRVPLLKNGISASVAAWVWQHQSAKDGAICWYTKNRPNKKHLAATSARGFIGFNSESERVKVNYSLMAFFSFFSLFQVTYMFET